MHTVTSLFMMIPLFFIDTIGNVLPLFTRPF
ncbi:hypothetical protein [Clostridium phage Maintenon]|nr:hypothetical protein [Clostridium phage Maintenon]DAM81708.1 MAG TPA: hypothetical protein [Caudoviricetes sp.]